MISFFLERFKLCYKVFPEFLSMLDSKEIGL